MITSAIRKVTICSMLIMLLLSCNLNLNSKIESFDSIVLAFEKRLKKDLVTDNIQGSISASIVKDNKIVWAKGFGYSDRNHKSIADTSTIYRTGSITKSFTAFLMMQLVEEGVIKLTDPVELYLPEVKNLIGYSPSTQITFLELATHHSGLIREPTLADAAAGTIESWESKVIKSISYTSFQYKPGENFSYSNIGYGILGLALSRAVNKPFMELIQNKIFSPLGMSSSYFNVPFEMIPKLASGINGGPKDLDMETPKQEHTGRGYKIPNGGIYSTPNDLSRFIMANLGYQQLLSQENLEFMQKGETSGKEDYGLGFFIKPERLGKIINHGGAVAGYTAYFAFDPKSRYGIVIMRNYNFGETDLQIQGNLVLNKLIRLNHEQKIDP
jgi:CubicO group peptidase (beta-lactamase class C family)